MISSCTGDSRRLWSRRKCLLSPPEFTAAVHSADDFGQHFISKIDSIRQSTAGFKQPSVSTRRTDIPIYNFTPVAAAEVVAIINRCPSKQCQLDPMPSWVLKNISDTMAPVIAVMSNASITQNKFPAGQKCAPVRPLLKKPTLDPSDLNSYRPPSFQRYLSVSSTQGSPITQIVLACSLLFSQHIVNTIQQKLLSAPWFNTECRRIKAKTRRLEKIYRSTRTDDARRRWRDHFEMQRSTFQRLYADYWRKVINDSEDPKILWRRLNALLQPATAVISPFTSREFASFFDGKIAAIRASTASADHPTVEVRDVPQFDSFSTAVTAVDVASSLRRAACKQCELDPAPTWLVKQCSDILSPVIACMINCSFSTATFAPCQKRATTSQKTWFGSI